ncbi:hypothetical protein JCM11641_003779 [Rhodosporidiobolus odoratus]
MASIQDDPQPLSIGDLSLQEAIPSRSTTSPSAPLSGKRQTRQALADELVAEELIQGAPSRNGGRFLTADHDPWSHNAWDQVEWGPAEEEFARAALEKQRNSPVPRHLQDEFNANPAKHWDVFYKHNKDNFFKDRAWLQTEFPELAQCLETEAGPKRIVEIGCGNGSTLFPLLAANQNPKLDLHGYDYSKEAVAVVRGHESFDPEHLTCDVWDLSSPSGPPPTVPPQSVDVLTMIFVLSALHPDEWPRAVENAWRMLKPGGVLLFRDYGRNDLAQLRFKANRYMQDGLYVRGDNTRVYFFERDELVYLFGGVNRSSTSSSTPGASTLPASTASQSTASASPAADPTASDSTPISSTATDSTAPSSSTVDSTAPSTDTLTTTTVSIESPSGAVTTSSSSTTSTSPPSPESAAAPSASDKVKLGETLTSYRLDLLQLGIDRRLLLNRKRQLKMMRVWLQGRWRKPLDSKTDVDAQTTA